MAIFDCDYGARIDNWLDNSNKEEGGVSQQSTGITFTYASIYKQNQNH